METELTKEERNAVYKKALTICDLEDEFMCVALKASQAAVFKVGYDGQYTSLTNYPEFLSKAPKGWDYLSGDVWKNGDGNISKSERLRVLTECINETEE